MFIRFKEIIAVLCIAALVAVSIAPAMESSYAASRPSLTSKSLYYLGDHVKGGLCLVSSNTYMLKRMAILVGSSKWSSITLSTINKQGIKYKEYWYKLDGYTYHVNKYKKFADQSQSGVKRELRALLKNRPEGVIIYGNKSQDYDRAKGKAADHGILITSYSDGTFWGIDPAHNRNGKSRGIERLSNTTIVTLKGVTHYMCIQDITYKSSSNKSTVKRTSTTTKKTTTKTSTNSTTKKTTTKATTTKPAASTLRIKNYSYPKTIVKGSMFDVKGVIKSNYKIRKVKVSIINSKGKAVISQCAYPKKKKYDLVRIDNYVKFGTLKTGKYTYRISAWDGHKALTLVKKSFKVVPTSNMKITGATYPTTLKKGQMFTIKGKVTSNYNLKKVTAGIYTTSGKAKSTASKKLSGKKTYNVYGLDEKIKFGSLDKGTYYYKVTATDAKKTKVLLNKKFVVK